MRLTPMLIAAGHEVTGSTRTPEKAQWLSSVGATPVLLDALNREQVHEALISAKPDVVIHMLTALPKRFDPKRVRRDLAVNDRLREDGTRDLVSAAQQAGARKMIAQSVAFAYMPLGGIAERPELRPEDDPLDFEAPKAILRTINALHMMEHTVRSADGLDGVVLRFGHLYGPGTTFARDGDTVERVRRRRLPVIGGGQGVWSFVHVDDAAAATVLALKARRGVYNIVDDEPAAVNEWLPELASTIGAPPPWHVKALLARPFAGAWGVAEMRRPNGASNHLVKETLRWKPKHSWRQSFHDELSGSDDAATDDAAASDAAAT